MRRLAFILVLLITVPLSAQQRDSPARQSALKTLTKSIDAAPADQRLAYNALLVAFVTFRDARLRHEVCVEKQPCTTTRTAEGERLEEDFVKLGYGFAPGQPPKFSSDALVAVDKTLNDYFSRVTSALPDACSVPNCTSSGTEREVQRDWIRYRDAWTTFGTLRFPDISSETWRNYLTIQRNLQLLSSYNGILQS